VDSARFNVTEAGVKKIHKFKAQSNQDGEAWVQELNTWKDYFINAYANECGNALGIFSGPSNNQTLSMANL